MTAKQSIAWLQAAAHLAKAAGARGMLYGQELDKHYAVSYTHLSTQVSHIIQNCGINFMPDRRNDWLFTGIGLSLIHISA